MSYSFNRRLIFIIYKEVKKLNTKRMNNPINEWANVINDSFQKKYKWPINTKKNVQYF
jgi:hypothetical protein